MAKREVPTNTNDWNKSRPAEPLDAQTWPEATVRETSFTRRPETAIQALLEAAPGETPEVSLEEITPIREAVAAAVERLEPRLRYVIEAIHIERLSYQQLADRMAISKTHAFRLARDAEQQLRHILSANQMIRERLNLETKHATWWEAAASHLTTIAPHAAPTDDSTIVDALPIHASAMREMAASSQFERSSESLNFFLEEIEAIGCLAASWLDNHSQWSVSDMADLLESKQQDYGHGNITSFGFLGIAVRLSDKVERMQNLNQKQGKARNESFVDTMKDIVGYAVIALMLDDGTFYMEV